ncbi:hypothetical protein [Aeromonas sp. sif2416]|uniref:hypothetical protein n=1 Tax=Aeromonas sp. sif2416 TaxID=2854793 RepID=UPI001C437ED1|nr:hypothetical protein [Aeromonas sp. sif2416]MBV7439413.1 hypothetical protein [Aeromonas sp. sif2416]
MRIFIAMLVSYFCAFAFASVSWAAPIERSLPVSVFIVANQGTSDLEIVADKLIFQSIYDVSLKTFLPLTIPFRVRSVTGQNISYDLFMSHLGAQCDGQPLSLTVAAMVGGDPIVLNEKHRFAGIENEHGVVISFPVIPQSGLSQQCEGHIGIIAELVV